MRLAGVPPIALRVRQRYEITSVGTSSGRWQVTVTGYEYALFDTAEQEILTYHWHPGSLSPVTTPHLHVGPAVINQDDLVRSDLQRGAVALRDDVARAHLPSGPISLPSVVRLVIQDFGVRPLQRRWQDILAEE